MVETKKPSYIKKLLGFYFARRWQSVFTILYFFVFGYFTVFYLGNVWIAVKFAFYTIANSTELLGISYLFLGVAFLLSILLPFAASVYALLLFYELWESNWEHTHKLLATGAIVVSILLIILFADELVRLVALQSELHEFVTENNLLR